MPSDSTTLAVAIVGACTGVGSLAWQVLTWRRNGPDLRVEACPGHEWNPTTGQWQRVLRVSVFNRGRGDVQLIAADLRFRSPSFRGVQAFGLTHSLGLPLTVEGQHGRTWEVPLVWDRLPPELNGLGALVLQLGSGRKIHRRVRDHLRGSRRDYRV